MIRTRHDTYVSPTIGDGVHVPKMLKPSQVAAEFDVHPGTVREWLAKGLLPSIKTPGGQYRINPADVSALLNQSPELQQKEPATA